MGGTTSLGGDINKDVEYHVDKSAPTTKINVRLHNGEVIAQEFNLTHTIDDIYAYVTSVAPVQGSFQLVEGFPPKPLADYNKTIGELKLQGSLLTQRLS